MDIEGLLKSGELKRRCSEVIRCKCTTCGEMYSPEEWEEGKGCQACGGDTCIATCGKCSGAFEKAPTGASHKCLSIAQYQATNLVAFAKSIEHPSPVRGGGDDKEKGRGPKSPPPPSPKPAPEEDWDRIGWDSEGEDPLYTAALEIVLKTRRPSISLVQRHLRIGYNRASRLIEKMEKMGVVSPMNDDGSRRILDGDGPDRELERDGGLAGGRTYPPKKTNPRLLQIVRLWLFICVCIMCFRFGLAYINNKSTQDVAPQEVISSQTAESSAVSDTSKHLFLGFEIIVEKSMGHLFIGKLDPKVAGLNQSVETGDMLLSVNGLEVNDINDLNSVLQSAEAHTITFKVLRGVDEFAVVIQPEFLTQEEISSREANFIKKVSLTNPSAGTPSQDQSRTNENSSSVSSSEDNVDYQALLKKGNCLLCHALAKRQIGPSFTEIATRYRGRADVSEMLVQKVRKGGKGNWGNETMFPTGSKITDQEISLMVEYILNLVSPNAPSDSVVPTKVKVSSSAEFSQDKFLLELLSGGAQNKYAGKTISIKGVSMVTGGDFPLAVTIEKKFNGRESVYFYSAWCINVIGISPKNGEHISISGKFLNFASSEADNDVSFNLADCKASD